MTLDIMVKDHSDYKRKPNSTISWATLADHKQGIFYMDHLTGRIVHTLAFGLTVVEQ